MSRHRLLFLCQTLPFPVDSGAHIRAYHTLRLLSTAFDVVGMFFYRKATRPDDEAVQRGLEGLRRLGKASAFPIPQEHDRGRLASDHLRSLVAQRPYTVFAYESREFRHALRQVMRTEGIDIVHLDSLDLSSYAQLVVGKIPVACSHHNVESSLLERRAAAEPSAARAAYVRLQGRLMAAEERRWVGRLDLNLAVSELDRRLLRERAPGARIELLPNCVDTSALTAPTEAGRHGLVFVGGYSWSPNLDAMTYFCERILPRIRRERPGYPVTWLAGTESGETVSFGERHGIEVRGFVDDIRPIIAGAACYVVPLRVGGGTRLKIVEAWALGSAVVSTSVGAEGLRADHGRNILLADDEERFTASVLGVLADPDLGRTLGSSGRRTAVEFYDWDAHRNQLVTWYQEILTQR